MGRLHGQVAIVTGGGSGIGRATARMLAAEGAQVIVAGRRPEPLAAVVAEIEQAGGRAAAKACDLEETARAGELATWTLATCGRVDILVNNAGHSSRVRSVRWVSEEEWRGVLDVNLTGVWALTQAVLPGVIVRGAGTIVTASSAAARRPGLIAGAAHRAAQAAGTQPRAHI